MYPAKKVLREPGHNETLHGCTMQVRIGTDRVTTPILHLPKYLGRGLGRRPLWACRHSHHLWVYSIYEPLSCPIAYVSS